MRVGLVVPHIFMQRELLPRVIFSPGQLALWLAEELEAAGAEVTLFSPGPVDTPVRNETVDLGYFERELALRGDDCLDLLKKHPLVFMSLARQAQSQLVARALAMANAGELDVVHIYTNEEDVALPFVQFCSRPVVLTHHDPYNQLVRYKYVFPRYKHLNWISVSLAQRRSMPADTNWVGNIYHGLPSDLYSPGTGSEPGEYLVYLGRIIEPKGVHLAIEAVRRYNKLAGAKLKLKIAGKHYAGSRKNDYWETRIRPLIDGESVEYLGHVRGHAAKQELLRGAAGLIVPSLFDEPFGMVTIEALACGTPVLGLDSGAIPEVINTRSGVLVDKVMDGRRVDEAATVDALADGIGRLAQIERDGCRREFERRFTLDRMCREHLELYKVVAHST